MTTEVDRVGVGNEVVKSFLYDFCLNIFGGEEKDGVDGNALINVDPLLEFHEKLTSVSTHSILILILINFYINRKKRHILKW